MLLPKILSELKVIIQNMLLPKIFLKVNSEHAVPEKLTVNEEHAASQN